MLKHLATVSKAAVRPQDMVARVSDEEFCVLLPDTTPEDAAEIAGRLRLAIAACVHAGRDTVAIWLAGAGDPLYGIDRRRGAGDGRMRQPRCAGRPGGPQTLRGQGARQEPCGSARVI
ncbi:diguanylate cyclase [Cupriavidus pinatubonensis]|nr:diguanylate cyclase [Cupriavidus pinatubonensis]TPQ31623.1 hypothetical protein C2U69_28345 [Cupriavidus pinatubonensis]